MGKDGTGGILRTLNFGIGGFIHAEPSGAPLLFLDDFLVLFCFDDIGKEPATSRFSRPSAAAAGRLFFAAAAAAAAAS